MSHITVPTKQVADIAKAVGYRRKTAWINPTTAVTLTDLNWSGGSKSVYTAIELATGKVASGDHLGDPAPWRNQAEGKTIELPLGVAIVRTGTFLGKPGMMTIYVRPENMPALIEGSAAP